MSNALSKSASHSSVSMLYSIEREAFVISVACIVPLVSCHISHESTVPNASSPFSARCCPSGMWSSIQRILVAGKYASMGSPVFSTTSASNPRAFSASQSGAVLRHCQTIALNTGLPVLRSQTIVVSRWLVMPIELICRTPISVASSSSSTVSITDSKMSCGSCSTQPGCG